MNDNIFAVTTLTKLIFSCEDLQRTNNKKGAIYYNSNTGFFGRTTCRNTHFFTVTSINFDGLLLQLLSETVK